MNKKNIKSTFSFIVAIIFMFSTLFCKNIAATEDTTLNLNITHNQKENCNHLEWTNLGENYSYRVFQKGNDEPIYQSIPTKNTVKTLNIYPDTDVSNTGLSNDQIDLDGNKVPDSGILKTWLLKENITDVTIDCVSLSSFNANPSKYLKKIDGRWNYNSVFYGMWNLWPVKVYPNDTAIEYLRNFIHEGGGFMTSHHTIGYTGLEKGVNKLWKEMGVEIFSTQPNSVNPNYSGRDSSGNLFDTVSFEELAGSKADYSPYWAQGNQVQIIKNGLLINYPFKVGKVGDIITIPETHGLGLLGKGEVWMNVYNPKGFNNLEFKELNLSPRTGEKGTNNFFVHTYNNTAIINSGHSFPSITKEETRIIANTLYYLSQITEETNCDDHKAQDITAPIKPNIENVTVNSTDNTINISLDKSQDIGTTYSYYVEATENSTGNRIKSDTKSSTITSGIKGYSIIVDENENTVPNNNVTTTSTNYTFNNKFKGDFYVHVAAIDNNDNISEVSTYKYTLPILKLTPSTTEKVKDKVTIKAEASGSREITKIITPDGKEVSGNIAEFDVDVNGTYTFKAIDTDGNEVTESININNIFPDIILNVEPNMNRVHLEEEFVVDLTIDNIKDIMGTDTNIKYDNSKLEFLGFEEIPGFNFFHDEVKDGNIRVFLFGDSVSNVINNKKTILKLRFKGVTSGDALIDDIKGRVSDGLDKVRILRPLECGETTINIVNRKLKDVYTFLDVSIISRHIGEDPESLLPDIDADLNLDGKIDQADVAKAYSLMRKNPNDNY